MPEGEARTYSKMTLVATCNYFWLFWQVILAEQIDNLAGYIAKYAS